MKWDELKEYIKLSMNVCRESSPETIGFCERCHEDSNILHKMSALESESFTVEVEVPETARDGACNYKCIFKQDYHGTPECIKYSDFKRYRKRTHDEIKPGPKCPRYKK